jgi:hypothetical protein
MRWTLRAAAAGFVLLIALIIVVAYPTSPGPLPATFPHIAREPAAMHMPTTRPTALPRHTTAEKPFEVDLRGCDLSRLDPSSRAADLEWASFDLKTIWPGKEKLPGTFDPQAVFERGKDPGLGVRQLHARGITGRGVGVAIIDSPLPVHHREYADRLRLYEEVGLSYVTREFSTEARATMHGAATASIAVGKTVGVAPEAELYHIATTPWGFPYFGTDRQPKLTYTHYADSIRRILAINASLPAERKIRVISLSIGWRDGMSGVDDITAAIKEAAAQNILVFSSSLEQTHHFKFHGLDRDPMGNPDDFAIYRPGKFWAGERKTAQPVVWSFHMSQRLMVPMDHRTVAGPGGDEDYAHYGSGGWSWCTPYLAGVYALACQADPALTPDRFWASALKTARTIDFDDAGEKVTLDPILDPVALIDSLTPQR